MQVRATKRREKAREREGFNVLNIAGWYYENMKIYISYIRKGDQGATLFFVNSYSSAREMYGAVEGIKREAKRLKVRFDIHSIKDGGIERIALVQRGYLKDVEARSSKLKDYPKKPSLLNQLKIIYTYR